MFSCHSSIYSPSLSLSGVHTKLTVAVILSLILLLPALAHAEGIMCEVGLCGEEDKQRTGWRDEKKRERLSAMPDPLEEDKVVITKARRHIPLHGTGGGGLCEGITSVLHLPS